MTDINEAVSALALASQQSALLRGALTSGFLAHCAGETSVEDLARVTSLGPGRVRDLCVALRAAGVLETDNPDRYRLSTTYAPLLNDGTDTHLANQLGGAAVRARLLEQMFTSDGPDRYQDLADTDRAALAASVTLAPSTALARTAMQGVVGGIPAWNDLLAAGDMRYLVLGCGLSGALLTMLQLHPRLTAVGVDLAADLLALAKVEAATLGVDDRVQYVIEDATAYTDPEPFDAVFWSQFFFPAATRVKALANAYERLRPGGLLIVPALIAPGTSAAEPQTSLSVLLTQGWEIPALTTDELCTELTTAGFIAATVHPSPFATAVVAHRP